MIRMLFLLLCLIPSGLFAKDVKPLFSSDEVLELQLNFKARPVINKSMGETGEQAAVLILKGDIEQSFDVKLSLRGNSRQKTQICNFPPLKLNFKRKQVKKTVFAGQNKLKLVTYCKNKYSFEQFSLREFAAYRLLNQLTDLSYRVRMARITYNDIDNRERDVVSYDFFIEDVDDLAKRNGLKEIDVDKIYKPDVEPEHSALITLFEYMIGNLDWSILSGTDDDKCCHNARLLRNKDEQGPYIPVIYDFDFSGLVNASYAKPPTRAKIRNVRKRKYRGFCVFNDQIPGAIEKFKNARANMYAVIDNIPGMSGREKKSTTKYLDGFFVIINDSDKIQSKIYDHCRTVKKKKKATSTT